MSYSALNSINNVYDGLSSQLAINRGAQFELDELSSAKCKLIFENWVLSICRQKVSIEGKMALGSAIKAVNGPYYRKLEARKKLRADRGSLEKLAISGAVVSILEGGEHGLWRGTNAMLRLRVSILSGLTKQALTKLCERGKDPYREFSSALAVLHASVTACGGKVSSTSVYSRQFRYLSLSGQPLR